MTDTAAISDRDEQMLARLAELDLAAAERVHGRLMAAEDAQEVVDLGRAYQRLARSLRQTLALKARLKRDREQAAQAAAAPAPAAPPPDRETIARRVRDVRRALQRVAWREHPEVEVFDWVAETIEERLARDCLEPDFGAEPLDDHIVRLCGAMGFPVDAALLWRDLADPPPVVDRFKPAARESSA